MNTGVKREAEDAIEEKPVILKKQKGNDGLAQAVQKEKAQAKTTKKIKKEETSSSDKDSSDSEEEQKVVHLFNLCFNPFFIIDLIYVLLIGIWFGHISSVGVIHSGCVLVSFNLHKFTY